MPFDTLFQKYGSHLILLIVAAFFITGALSLSANSQPAAEDAPLRAEQSVANSSAAAAEPADASSASAPAADTPTSFDSIPMLSDAGLAPNLDPETYQGAEPAHELVRYEVARGDTPNKIAERFNIQPETLLGGNGWLSEESSLLQAGVELVILPVDGVLHDVEIGDSLDSIATQYGVAKEEIIAYGPNNLEFPYRVYPDTQILVPGAVRELFVWTPPKLPDRGSGQARVVGTGTFTAPVNAGCVSQYYLPWHPGLDVALPVGNGVYAMDTGTVSYASWAAGSYYDYGNLVVIDHGNGFETFYAHLSGLNVYPGQVVTQGQYIGASGNTGRSTGPHIHVEIRLNNGRYDPLSYITRGYGAC